MSLARVFRLLVPIVGLAFSPSLAQAQSTTAPEVKSSFAEINSGKLYHEIAGEGRLPVLIRGGQMDSRIWDEQFALFAKSYRVILYDFRGFGKSAASTNVFAGGDDLAGLIRFLGVKKAPVVDLSLGGHVAIDFALAHPDTIEALILGAQRLSGLHFRDDHEMAGTGRAAQLGDWGKVTDLRLKSGYMTAAMENPTIAPRLCQLVYENAHENLDNFGLERVLDPPAIERLPEIKAPTLIIVGNRDVADIHEICGLLRARIPGAKEVVIQGSGHIVNIEKPQEFNTAVLSFLVSTLK